jgi:sulfide dehydrogenase [flavocytochrome c] flavoprotein subunit
MTVASARSMLTACVRLSTRTIFVIGDACIAGDMPKSGFSANSQAKVAAMNIRGDLIGSKVFPAKYANTCWSLIETG